MAGEDCGCTLPQNLWDMGPVFGNVTRGRHDSHSPRDGLPPIRQTTPPTPPGRRSPRLLGDTKRAPTQRRRRRVDHRSAAPAQRTRRRRSRPAVRAGDQPRGYGCGDREALRCRTLLGVRDDDLVPASLSGNKLARRLHQLVHASDPLRRAAGCLELKLHLPDCTGGG